VKTRRIFVYGAGGHGKVVADILISKGDTEFAGFVDDREELRGTQVLGFPVFGDHVWLHQEASKSHVAIALGVGESQCRQLLADRCSRWQIDILTLVHPAATVSRAAELGRGTVVMAGAVINPDAKVGTAAIVNTGAVVEHDVEVGDYAHLAPNAAMGGASHLGVFSHLGLGAAVRECIRIGPHTIVGAGAVVVHNLPGHVVAMGVPARIRRQLCKARELVRQGFLGNVGP
jgi:sugar O-acyltransferase (sialic acid O-acetyltransferase NeuD family)